MKTDQDPVAEAHDVLAKHYGEPVLPIGETCYRISLWIQALVENKADGPYGEEVGEALRKYGGHVIMFARKSNLLYRLLYLNQPLRKEKCPKHEGRWSGYGWGDDICECQSGLDITGWLP